MPEADRPRRLVLVSGTGTEVGKTWVAVRLLEEWRALGVAAVPRKLAQSFDAGDDVAGTDAALLGLAAGHLPEAVCPPRRWYPLAMAPPMASEELTGEPVRLDDLLGELSWAPEGDGVPGPEVGLLETAGGVRSPQAHDGDVVDLVERLRPELVVLVAHAGLGTLNDVRLGAGALAGARRLIVVLNRYDPGERLHELNRRWLTERDRFEVVVTPGEERSLAERALSR